MKISITKNKYIFILIWIVIWHISSIIISQDILLVSPVKVLYRLVELMMTLEFYISVINSVLRIFFGFILAVVFGVLFAIISKRYKLVYDFLIPVINVIKVTPVASFIILALMWVDTDSLSILIAFLITFPVFFLNIYNGFNNIDVKMLEMAKVYKFKLKDKINHIYIPSLQTFFVSSVSVGVSLSFKSGVAGEVIAIANNTIGGNLQNAKVLLETADIFCWTIVIVIISIFIEKLCVKAVKATIEGLNND